MPKEMSADALAKAREGAQEIDTYDFRSDDDEDDYITALLYKAKSGRHFRSIESSGMSSVYSGAGEFGEWLTTAEVANWNEFDS